MTKCAPPLYSRGIVLVLAALAALLGAACVDSGPEAADVRQALMAGFGVFAGSLEVSQVELGERRRDGKEWWVAAHVSIFCHRADYYAATDILPEGTYSTGRAYNYPLFLRMAKGDDGWVIARAARQRPPEMK